MSGGVTRVVVAGRDAALWLSAAVLRRALEPAGVEVDAVELPSELGPADIYSTLPPMEALHNQLRIDEAALLRATRGCFSLGHNFTEAGGGTPAFFHAYGSAGTQIAASDFFAYWLKARHYGLEVPLDDFSLTAAAARQGRLMIPDEETEGFGRTDYGYHLPAAAYAHALKGIAVRQGVTIHSASEVTPLLDEAGAIKALALDGGRRIEGDLFVDATGPEALLIGALGGERESWLAHFPADRLLVASGPAFPATPVYAEVRAWAQGWTAMHPGGAQTHLVQAWSSETCSDEDALRSAANVSRLSVADVAIRPLDPGSRASPWECNCIAIGDAACAFDPIHGVGLHGVQLGLVHLLGCFPASEDWEAQRVEYNRVTRSAFDRVRDFQAAHYVLARYDGPFWAKAREAEPSPALVHSLALFRARGEVAPFEDESFSPDSWRALLTGHGLVPESWLPSVDRISAGEMKTQFRHMLGFVRDQVLKRPTHDQYLARILARDHG